MTIEALAQELLFAFRQGVAEKHFPWGDGTLIFAKEHDGVYTLWLQRGEQKNYQGVFSPGMFATKNNLPLGLLSDSETLAVVAEYLETLQKEPWGEKGVYV